jgi:hypothetical protein
MVFNDLITNIKKYYSDIDKKRIAPFYDSVKDYDGQDLTNKIKATEYPHFSTLAAQEYYFGLQRMHEMVSASPKTYYKQWSDDIAGRHSFLDTMDNAESNVPKP